MLWNIPEKERDHNGRFVAVRMRKRGRYCVMGKLVEASPCGRFVFAVPYRNRQCVKKMVSIPVKVLRYAQEQGATHWVIRLDREGVCKALPLSNIENLGMLQSSHGIPELFVRLTAFEDVPWQTWPYVEEEIDLSDDDFVQDDFVQDDFFGGAAA
jgi:hypothetical protein